jgi:hypothetical protein
MIRDVAKIVERRLVWRMPIGGVNIRVTAG